MGGGNKQKALQIYKNVKVASKFDFCLYVTDWNFIIMTKYNLNCVRVDNNVRVQQLDWLINN